MDQMNESRFASAAVIGTGMMGPGIACTLALGGVPVTILSRAEDSAQRGLASSQAQLDLLQANGLADNALSVRNLISASTDFDNVIANAAIVIESAPENMQYKQELFAKLDSIAKPEAVLASNTSGLSITATASRCKRPERVLTTHFWNPAHLMPLVEIVKGERTSDISVEAVRQLLASCGKVPVVIQKDRPGQLGNRLQMALVREAVNIIAEGIADAEAVDLAARYGFGLRLPEYGILEHQDLVGLDLGLAVNDYVTKDLNNDPKAPDLYHQLVAQGHLGAKTGKGFYDWATKSPDDVKRRRDEFVIDCLRRKKAKG